MPDQKFENIARGLGFMAGILSMHEKEPLCGKCRAFVKTVNRVVECVTTFEGSHGKKSLPSEMEVLYLSAKEMIAGLRLPEEPVSQKKLGNCNLPDRGCFLKYSSALFDQISQSDNIGGL